MIAVICGMPAPLTTRVVQIDPGPMPDLDRVGARGNEISGRFFSGDVSDNQIQIRGTAALPP